MIKLAYILPGSRDSTKEEKYQKIGDYFRNRNITPIFVDIDWKRKTMSDYINQFLTEYTKHKGDKIYFQGFSWGAMIVFFASAQVKVDTQILCSLSPYFAEDLPTIPNWWRKYIGKKRLADFQKLNSSSNSDLITCNTIMIAGNKEGKEVATSNQRIFSELNCPKSLYIIPNSKHDISNPDYQEKIKEVINGL